MDKNFKQKAKDFLKKEGFFVVLFVCLCVVTMVAAVSIKKANVDEISKKPPIVKSDESDAGELAKTDDITEKTTSPNAGAEQVKNKKPETKTVNNTNTKFINPVEGKISHKFVLNEKGNIPMVARSDKEFMTLHGMNIEVKPGTEVKAASDGKVQKIGREVNGLLEEIEIKHTNGITVKYANLDKATITLKEGDTVKASQVIAKTGKTSPLLDYDKFGDFLNLQVWTGNKQENPTKYFTNYLEKK